MYTYSSLFTYIHRSLFINLYISGSLLTLPTYLPPRPKFMRRDWYTYMKRAHLECGTTNVSKETSIHVKRDLWKETYEKRPMKRDLYIYMKRAHLECGTTNVSKETSIHTKRDLWKNHMKRDLYIYMKGAHLECGTTNVSKETSIHIKRDLWKETYEKRPMQRDLYIYMKRAHLECGTTNVSKETSIHIKRYGKRPMKKNPNTWKETQTYGKETCQIWYDKMCPKWPLYIWISSYIYIYNLIIHIYILYIWISSYYIYESHHRLYIYDEIHIYMNLIIHIYI